MTPTWLSGSKDRARGDMIRAEDSGGDSVAASVRAHCEPGPWRAERCRARGAEDGGGAAWAWLRPGPYALDDGGERLGPWHRRGCRAARTAPGGT